MNNRKKSFVLYNDYIRHISRLSDREAGQLFKAIFSYAESGEEAELGAEASMAFSFIASQLDRDREKYEEICEKRRSAAKKGREKLEQMRANESDNDTATENETVTVKDTESDTDNDTTPPTESSPSSSAAEAAELFNRECPSLPAVTRLGKSRRRAVNRLLRECSMSTLLEVFRKAEGSAFLRGENSRGWKATFDWLTDPDNMQKVLDGNYDNPPRESGDKDDFDIEKYKAFINQF